MTRRRWNASTMILALCAACSGKDEAGGGSGDTNGGTSGLSTGDGTVCVPDDAAGTTWDEAGHFIPILKVATYQYGEFEGHATRWYTPEQEPRGVATFFHGGGGKTGESDYLEWDPLFNELIQAGWAVAVTESEGTIWAYDNTPDNPDLARIMRWRDELIATTTITEDTPWLPIGFSGGGNMVPRFIANAPAYGVSVPGGISHNSGAQGDRAGVPFLWISSANDYDKDGNNTEDAQREYDAYIADGYDGTLIETPEIPWNPMRMIRNEKYDATESQAVFDEMVTLGLIDENGDRIPDIQSHAQWTQLYVDQSVLDGPERVVPQIEVVWAVHRYNGIHAIEECQWVMKYYP